MPTKTETEILAELESLLNEAEKQLAEARAYLRERQRQECTDACQAVQRKMQKATKLMLGVEPN